MRTVIASCLVRAASLRPLTRSILFNMTLCKYFQQGNCKFGGRSNAFSITVWSQLTKRQTDADSSTPVRDRLHNRGITRAIPSNPSTVASTTLVAAVEAIKHLDGTIIMVRAGETCSRRVEGITTLPVEEVINLGFDQGVAAHNHGVPRLRLQSTSDLLRAM